MRGAIAYLLALLFRVALTDATSHGKLYTYDADATSRSIHRDVFDANIVKTILERRIKSSQSTILGTIEDSTISLIEELGGRQAYLFSDDEVNSRLRKLLIICESGNIGDSSTIPSAWSHSIGFPSISPYLVSDDFIYTLLGQNSNSAMDSRVCSIRPSLSEPSIVSEAYPQDARRCLSEHNIFSGALDALNSVSAEDLSSVSVDSWVAQEGNIGVLKVWGKKNVANTAIANAFVRYLEGNPNSNASPVDEFTILVHSGPFSRLTNLADNQLDENAEFAHNHRASRSLHRADGLPSRSNSKVSSNLIPICHARNESCVSVTSSCSGHGFCYLKYASNNTDNNCYACKCVNKNPDGTMKKVQWGGAACEKKDVSSPFFLLTGITVLIVVAIGCATGMLFRVGQEDLPSVISAGVGGPKDSRG